MTMNVTKSSLPELEKYVESARLFNRIRVKMYPKLSGNLKSRARLFRN